MQDNQEGTTYERFERTRGKKYDAWGQSNHLSLSFKFLNFNG